MQAGLKVQFIEKIRKQVAQSSERLSTGVRIVAVLLACFLVGGLMFWLCNEIFYFYIARSYVEELADAFDLNRGITRAMLWASFAIIVVLSGLVFSFSKSKRRIGYAGLLALAIGHSLLLGKIETNFRRNGVAEKCYVMTRTSITTSNRTGIDPETGRECRPLTPQIAEKIELYRTGHRPTQLTSGDPTFFDPTTGEPVVWYSQNSKAEIELFDLMGFHPKTGEELVPITRQIADAWKIQNEKIVRRAAGRISDPDKFGFFDPVSGSPKVWYWRSDTGDYEFYDGPGFHARAGDQFKVITRDTIADWRQRLDAIAAKNRAAQEQQDRDARAKAEQQAQEARAIADRIRLENQVAAEALQKQQQSATDCDRLAANPTDSRKIGDGVTFDLLKHQADEAFDACTKAVQNFPSEFRYQYQLGRAAQFKDRKQAFEIFTRLVQANYVAAFDNLGGIYLYDRKDVATAIQLFKRGSELGDADSMVSLVDLIDRGLIQSGDPEQTKLALLNRAAQLGHAGAQRAYETEFQKANQARVNQATQQQMMQLFGAFVQGVARR